jgi:hypothetical protein
MSQAVPRKSEIYVARAFRGEEASHWSAVNQAPGVSQDMMPAVIVATKLYSRDLARLKNMPYLML